MGTLSSERVREAAREARRGYRDAKNTAVPGRCKESPPAPGGGESRIDENQFEGIVELHLSHDSLIQANVGDRGYDGADYVRRYRW